MGDQKSQPDVKQKVIFFHTNADYLVGLRLPMLMALVKSGYTVKAFAPNMAPKHASVLADFGIESGRYRICAAGLNPIRDAFDLIGLYRLISIEKPDVAFFNNAKPVALGTLAAALAKIPRRLSLVGGLGFAFIEGERAGVKRVVARAVASLLYWVAFRLSTRVIFHNVDDLRYLTSKGICPPGKGAVINGSGVDLAEFTPAEKINHPTFVFVGRLLYDKGIREFLRAARVTKAKFSGARFLVLGGVDQNPASISRDLLQSYIDDGIVEWHGHVDDVRPFLRESSVFVLPSYREGVPRSALEAMACGLAIVTADSPGCRETVVPGVNGLMVPVRDADRLADVLCCLCEDLRKVEAMGVASRELAEHKFSVEKINAAVVQIMREM